MANDIFDKIRDAILKIDEDESLELTKEAIKNGIAPLEIIDKALRPSLDKLGKDFEEYKVAIPELVLVGDIATKIGNIVEESLIQDKEIPDKGSIALGTVKGDVHSIGKNIVGVMMKAYGYKVIDLGVDVDPDEFLDVASDVDAIGLSALLTLATKSMKETIERILAQYPDKVIIIGGAAADPALADTFGIHYGADSQNGVKILEETLQK